MILILTGPTRSHKTTTLLNWASERNDCGGVLTPDQDGLRMLFNVHDKILLPFQKNKTTSSTDISIGRFYFDAHVFSLASKWLDAHLTDPNLNYIILDEVGPLELNGRGWDHWIRTSLKNLGDKTLILVVRHSLLNDVIHHYGLTDAQVELTGYFLNFNSGPG